MKRGLKLVGLGVLAYLVFLVASLPAPLVVAQLPAGLTGTLIGVRGTVWSGQAESLMLQGVDLGSLRWSMSPFAILLGRASTALELQGNELTGTAEVTARPGGALSVRKLRAATSPSLIDRFQPLPAELKGEVFLDLETFDYEDGTLSAVSGELRWDKAAIGAPYELSLGQYTLVLETRDGDIRGTLREQGSPLRTSGNLVLQPNGQFRLAVRLTPTDGTPQQLRDLLGLLGKTDRAGGVTLRHQGKLPGPRRPS